MIPNVKTAINSLSQRILTNVLPNIDATYVVSDSAMLAMLLPALANEAESGVANRLEDISTMKEILELAMQKGVALSDDFSIEAACSLNMDLSMTLTHVNECHDALTRELVSLHATVETNEQLQDLNIKIWSYLAQASERHALAI